MNSAWSFGKRLLSVLALSLGTSGPLLGASFGTLSNFDVVNDTPGLCHGFEIELEDIDSSHISYTFGGSYIRYGTPEILAGSDPARPSVVVRYRRWNGSEWEATPVAPANLTPGGHDCYANGPVGNYQGSGCEHFGVSLSKSPSRTNYRWIVASNPSEQNTAFTAVPQPVNLPIPVWNVVAVPAGNGVRVDVVAEVEPVEEENHAQHGEPQWMKVFKIKSELDLQPEDLVRLLLGAPNNVLPDETEIESEWKLVQSKPGDAEDEEEDADVKEDRIDSGDRNRSIVRRYEFYRYTGPRDPENNEALPCIDDDQPVPPDAPVEGCSDLGGFVGAQNVAVDMDLTAADRELPDGETGMSYAEVALVFGGLAPYTLSVLEGSIPDGMTLDLGTGILAGSPSSSGSFAFTIEARDTALDRLTAQFQIRINGPTPTPTVVIPESTPTPTPTQIPLPSETPTSPPPTWTPTPPPICTGNCSSDAAVTVDELITLVNIALEILPLSACAGGIPQGQPVDIALIVQAVVHALEGCPTG